MAVKFSEFESAVTSTGMSLVGFKDGKNVQLPASEFAGEYVDLVSDQTIAGNKVYKDAVTMKNGLRLSSEIAAPQADFIFDGDTLGTIYSNTVTRQLNIERFDASGVVESKILLGSDGVSISGPAGGAPIIESAQDITTKEYVDAGDGALTDLIDALEARILALESA